MEYDNDRKIIPFNRTEMIFWCLLVLFYPLINSLSFFPAEFRMWLVLFVISGLLFPVYFLYGKIFETVFLIRRHGYFFALISGLFFLVIHVTLFGFYTVVNRINPETSVSQYFSWGTATVLRESAWILLNLSFTAAIVFIRKEWTDKRVLADAQKDNRYYKLRYLRSQLNPHFLFNTLNSIYSLSLQRSEKTPEVVVKLADIFRYMIYECNEERIPLNKEIAFIRNYIDIEQIRHKADIRFDVEGETDDILIEPFLFISFIENGFKHALDNTYDNPFIYITLKAGEGQTVLNVINSSNADLEIQAKKINGKGLSTSRNLLDLLYPRAYDLNIIQTDRSEDRVSQLRLRNARERLETLYPDSHTLDVILRNNTFTVSLVLKTKAA